MAKRMLATSCLALFVLASQAAAAKPKAAAKDPLDTVIEVSFEKGVSLRELAKGLKAAEPRLNFIVVEEPTRKAFSLPEMKLRDVPIRDLLQSLDSLGLRCKPRGTIITLQWPMARTRAEAVVRTYPLSDAIETVQRGAAWRTGGQDAKVVETPPKVRSASEAGRAMDAVLSLVRSAVQLASGDGPMPTLQVHEETRTLLVRGTNDQQSIVSKAIQTLMVRQQTAKLAKAEREALQARMEAERARNEADEKMAKAAESLRDQAYAQARIGAMTAAIDTLQAKILNLEKKLAEAQKRARKSAGTE